MSAKNIEPSSVDFTNIVKRYRSKHGAVTAVEGFTLSVRPGELVSFLGPSGCGKTTTLRMIAGFEEITEGELLISGQRMNDIEPHRRPISMVFQSYALFPHLSVRDNVAFGLKLRKESGQKIRSLVDTAMETMNIGQYADRAPHELSGGQQQRVALARAIVTEPRVLLFDEPLSNLDAKLRVKMRTEIRRIQQDLGITAIFVTHDQEEAMSISDRIVVMRAGKIEQVGTPEDIYEEPVNQFVADFIGSSNLFDVRHPRLSSGGGGAVVRLFGQDVSVPIAGSRWEEGAAGKALLRPERLRVHSEGAEVGGQITAPGRVTRYQYFGDHTRLECETAEGAVKARLYGQSRHWKVGEGCLIAFEPQDIRLIKAS
ncbi:ABC transporter ATP-binding protein [Kocuria massiliensis]|uniref:ABC transporter ATP-binding protein n=1 Tax=Kocuria massiliensis TaxID=1926282 RepID=UPI0022B949CD|nr:ABC transporter ATP-binding protein [Kocuria massiliensis]